MSYTDVLDSVSANQWSAVSLVVEAGLTLYEGNTRVAALQLGAAALTYRSPLLGTIARLVIELYKRI
jgi:hypothetical protein